MSGYARWIKISREIWHILNADGHALCATNRGTQFPGKAMASYPDDRVLVVADVSQINAANICQKCGRINPRRSLKARRPIRYADEVPSDVYKRPPGKEDW